jgi:DNA-binding IscR family transcriptional regulator
MLVLQTVILLVHTNHILKLDGFTLGVGAETIEIFDMAKAVTAKGELVCCNTKTNVTNVKGLLAVVRGTRV